MKPQLTPIQASPEVPALVVIPSRAIPLQGKYVNFRHEIWCNLSEAGMTAGELAEVLPASEGDTPSKHRSRLSQSMAKMFEAGLLDKEFTDGSFGGNWRYFRKPGVLPTFYPSAGVGYKRKANPFKKKKDIEVQIKIKGVAFALEEVKSLRKNLDKLFAGLQ